MFLCYHTKFRHFRSHLFGIRRGSQKIFLGWMLGSCSLGMGVWLTPRNTLLCHMLSHQICLLYVKSFGRRYKIPKFLGMLWLRPKGRGVANAPETRYCPTCYCIKFRRPRSNRLGVGRGSQKFGEQWGPAPRYVADPKKYASPPPVLPCQIWSF